MTDRTVQGIAYPAFLYGTAWKEERTQPLTRLALEAGFRGFDTANQRKHYVEAAVGEAIAEAIRDGLVTREALFLQTKYTSLGGQDHRLPYDKHAPVTTQVHQSFERSLEHLHTDWIDAYILHGPSTYQGLADEDWEAWRAMEALQQAGKTRLIGVSNVTLEQLQMVHHGAVVQPAFVQNRCYARHGWDREVRAFCQTHGIVYQGFSLLTANRRELSTPAIKAIASRLGCTVPQVIFRFALEVGMLPLTGTSNPLHMRQDREALQLALRPDEIETIAGISAP